MKKIFTLTILVLSSISLNAQAFSGKYDSKFQVGANIQKNGSGINFTYDYGVGENMSIGLTTTYLLGVNKDLEEDFGDRFDLKARFNANLGNVMEVDENFDFYPGLDISLKNFGGHLGIRYFFSQGFGLYSEFGFPIAKYKTANLSPAEKLNNQAYFNIGASFNI